MNLPVPRPPFQRARVVGSGFGARLLVQAIAARAAAVTEWIPETAEAEIPGIGQWARSAALAEESEGSRPAVDLLVVATAKSTTVESLLWIGRHLSALVIVVSDSLVEANGVGAAATGLASDCFVTAARPMLAPRLAAEESPDEAFVGRPVAIASAPRVPEAALAQAERFWILLGAIPVVLDPEALDRRAAATEWLAPWSAAALARVGAHDVARGSSEEMLAGPAFLEATSLLVREPVLAPPSAVRRAKRIAPAIRSLADELSRAAEILEAGDQGALEEWLLPAISFRRRFPDL
jgi:prephenate dehydrogenase